MLVPEVRGPGTQWAEWGQRRESGGMLQGVEEETAQRPACVAGRGVGGWRRVRLSANAGTG